MSGISLSINPCLVALARSMPRTSLEVSCGFTESMSAAVAATIGAAAEVWAKRAILDGCRVTDITSYLGHTNPVQDQYMISCP